MHEISESDRDAIRLRFLERLPVAVVGERLGVTENAAAKRIERALEKLRSRFARHGITSTSIALVTALEGKACVAAPAGLVTGVIESALTAVAAASAGTAGLGLFTFMSTTKATLCLVAAAVIFGSGAVLIRTQAQSTQSTLAASIRRTKDLNAKLTDLQSRLAEERNRVRVAEGQNEKLLLTAKKMQAASAAQAEAEAEPITSELVSTRFKRAQELVRTGDAETALRELLWCYNVGMPRISNWGPVRTTSLLVFGRLGERYPPALDALRELREKALQRHEASAADLEATRELATINRALKDDEANVRFFDQLPPEDRRRRMFASASYDFLIAQRRYNDAAEGRPYSSISSSFERMTQNGPLPADTANPVEVQQQARAFAIEETAKNIEMLAGAGEIVHAKALAHRLLAFDSSESTKALIQQHAARSGHANLLMPATTP